MAPVRPFTQPGNTINYEGALGLALEILARFVAWFDTIIIIEGNHDDRINRATGGEVWFGMLLREAQLLAGHCQVIFSRYGYLYVKTARGPVYICHPQNFSSTPVRLAQQLYQTINGPDWDPRELDSPSDKCHVVVTHCHLINSGFSPDGARECHAIGTLRDPVKTRYKQQGANKHYEWNQGFLYVKSGFFYIKTRVCKSLGLSRCLS